MTITRFALIVLRADRTEVLGELHGDRSAAEMQAQYCRDHWHGVEVRTVPVSVPIPTRQKPTRVVQSQPTAGGLFR